MANLINLFRLQQTETQIEELEEELATMESTLQTKAPLETAQAEFDAANAKKRDAERMLKDAELALASLESEKKAVEKKLYGGTVNNSKELTQLQSEIGILDKRREKLDEKVLSAMDNLDSTVNVLSQKETVLKEAKTRFDEEIGLQGAKRDKLTKQLHDLNARRDTAIKSVEEPLLEEYLLLKKTKRGVAIAAIQKNSCGGCNMGLSEGSIGRAREYELVHCASCGRILFMDKEVSKSIGEF